MSTKSPITITWGASGSVSVAAGGSTASDAFAVADDCEGLSVNLEADNNGTPASGDTIAIRVLHSYDGGLTFETDDKPQAAIVDTSNNDPAVRRASVDPMANQAKIHVLSGAAANAITVSATGQEVTTS